MNLTFCLSRLYLSCDDFASEFKMYMLFPVYRFRPGRVLQHILSFFIINILSFECACVLSTRTFFLVITLNILCTYLPYFRDTLFLFLHIFIEPLLFVRIRFYHFVSCPIFYIMPWDFSLVCIMSRI